MIKKFDWKNSEHRKALFWRIVYNLFKKKGYDKLPLMDDYYEKDAGKDGNLS